ncbi:TOG array regulator of axonemal microtubules protein 1 [Trichonephila clavipes]|nr:TOG array regulator of axonemal microtubules protein 1 [Trichonephila clavipes]
MTDGRKKAVSYPPSLVFYILNQKVFTLDKFTRNHRNGAVRKVAAQSLLAVAEKMGTARILTSKDVTERLLPTTALFLMDGMPLTRWYGRRIYQLLMTHPSFDKLLLRYVQPSTLRNINSILDSIRKKGAGDMPKEGVSARTLKNETYRNGHLNRTM